jgi:hypothetical protein
VITFVVSALILVPLIVALTVCVTVWGMSRRSLRLTPAPPRRYARQYQAADRLDPVAKRAGFQHVGCFHLNSWPSGFIAAWCHADRPTYFCLYVTGGTQAYDFVTIFADDIGLTTGSHSGGALFPSPPGEYKQILPGLGLDRLWSRHLKSEDYLMQQGRIGLARSIEPFDQIFVRSIRREMAYIRSRPRWPFRALYWYAIGGRKRRNLTIQQQHEHGLIALPNEPGFSRNHTANLR